MEYKTDSLLVHLARAGDEDACEKLVKNITQVYINIVCYISMIHMRQRIWHKKCLHVSFPIYIDIKNMEKLRIIFIQLPEISLKIITKRKRYSIRGTAKIRGL